MKNTVCCFTGHREIPAEKYMYIKGNLDEEIENQIKKGVTTFCAGGAKGFDTIAAVSVLAARRSHPEIKLVLILPCANQAQYWSELDKLNYEEIKRRADEVIVLSEHYTNFCMQLRNRALVDRSGVCICYLEKNTGGTAYTVNYAKKQGLEIINVIDEKR